MRRRTVLGALAIAAFLGLLTYGLASKATSGPQVGEMAPVNELERLDGGDTGSLAEHRGRWVLVNFWASWCDPCRDEAPDLQALQSRFGGERFTVLGIDTRDLSSDAIAFVEEFGLTYPQLRDGDGSEARAWGTTGVPETFLVDPGGVLRVTHRGPVDEQILRERFLPHIVGSREATR